MITLLKHANNMSDIERESPEYVECWSLAVLVLFSLLLFVFSSAVQSQDWVLVYEEPRHKLVFNNDQVMILNVNLPPGYESLYHKHELDTLYVTISGTRVWAKPLNGEKREVDVATGDLRFSSDNHELPHIHQVGNIGTSPFHIIGVGVKGEATGAVDPVNGDMTGMELVDERANAGVYRILLKPGEKSGEHKHNLSFTHVYMTSGEMQDASGLSTPVKAGEFLWHPGGESHRYVNSGNTFVEIIEVQAR